MANPNPFKARIARQARRKPSPGTIAELREKLWRAMERAEEFLDDGDPAIVFRAAHTLGQVCAPYLRALEIGELEQRFAAIEKRLDEADREANDR